MLDYALRRLVMTFFVVVLIMTFLALLIQLVPGDPVRLVLGAKAPESLVQSVRHDMYLDKSVPAQVYYFFTNALHGDLGVDFQSQRSVTSLIWTALPHTAILALASLALAGLLGVPLGVYAATHPGGWLDRVTTVVSISLITMPAYVAGLLLLLVFSVHWSLMPATGVGSLSDPADYLRHLTLPAIALAVTWIGYLARLVRTSMLEVLNERYILAARSQGIRERLVVYKYALRNAVIPTIAVVGVGLGTLLGGAIFVEVIFARAGLGMLIYNAIQTRNFPIVRGGVLVVALLFVGVNLLTDFVYHMVDPRSCNSSGLLAVAAASRDGEAAVVRVPAAAGSLARLGGVLREVARRPAGLFGLVVICLLFVVVVAAPLVAPYSPYAQDIVHRLEGPSMQHLLGTDELGRDLLSRVIFGARIALGVAIPAVLIAMFVGMLTGLLSGYLGGGTDQVAIVGMDAIQAFPAVILALALLAVLGPSLRNVVIVIGVALAPGYARVVRAMTRAAKQNQYVEAELSLGAGSVRIAVHHLLPNIAAPLFILIAMDIPSAIAIEAGLAFLGLGVPPPSPSWGALLADGFSYVLISPWAIIAASAALMLTTLGFAMLGETLRDVLDPKLSGVRGRGSR